MRGPIVAADFVLLIDYLVRRNLPERRIVDVVIEGVGVALLHVVVEDPGDHPALVQRVFLERSEG